MKKIVFLLIYYFFINNVVIKADLNIDRLIITNMEIGTDLVVYECQETEDSIHFIVIYDIKNDTYHRLLNNYDGYINDDLLYPSISSNDEYITYTSSATNISDDEIQYCYGYFDDILKPCSGIYIYDIETKKSLLIKNNDEYLNNNSFLSKINSSGEYVVFESAATNGLNVFFNECLYNNINQCTNIYKYHIETKHLQLVSTKYDNYGSNFNSINPSISGDGRYITFQSAASNLSNINNRCLNKDEDNRNICSNVYMYDSKFNVIKPISSYNNELLDDSSGNAVISKDGKFVVFESYSNMLSSSKNNKKKLFLYDLNSDNLKLISKKNNNINNRDCNLIDLSDDGKYALFDTNSTNFNSNGVRNIFVINVFNSKFSWVSEYEKIKNVKFSGKNIAFFDKEFHFNKIDDVSPKIDKNQSIYVVKDNVYDLASKLIYSDNLSSNDDVKIYFSNMLVFNCVGEYKIEVKAVDEFNNICEELINVIVIEKDEIGPIFSGVEEIKILKGSTSINISNYIKAVDLVDGELKIYIMDDGNLDLNRVGTYKIDLMAKDRSNNITYKEIVIVIYENNNLTYYYELILIIAIVLVIIFSIFRVK